MSQIENQNPALKTGTVGRELSEAVPASSTTEARSQLYMRAINSSSQQIGQELFAFANMVAHSTTGQEESQDFKKIYMAAQDTKNIAITFIDTPRQLSCAKMQVEKCFDSGFTLGRYLKGENLTKANQELARLNSIHGPLSLDQVRAASKYEAAQGHTPKKYNPVSQKEISRQIKEMDSSIRKLSSGKINREISQLTKLQKSGALSSGGESIKRLSDLKKMKELTNASRVIYSMEGARTAAKFSLRMHLINTMASSGDDALMGMAKAYSFTSNRYVVKTTKLVAKGSMYTGRAAYNTAAVLTKKGFPQAGHLALKNPTVSNAVSKVGNSKAYKIGQRTKSLTLKTKGTINGGAYSAARKKLQGTSVDRLLKKYTTKVSPLKNKILWGNNKFKKFNTVVSKALRIVSAPIRFPLALFSKLMAAISSLLAWLLGFVLIAAVLFSIITLIFTTVFTDDQEVFIDKIVEKKDAYEREIVDKFNSYPNKEGFSLDDPQIIYVGRQSVDNIKEVVSMTCVYLQQDLENDKYMKRYTDKLWEDSHKLIEERETVYCSGCETYTTVTENADGTQSTSTHTSCPGHDKVTLYVYTYGFDPVEGKTIFDVDSTPIGATEETQDSEEYDPQNDWMGWTDENKDWALSIYENNDWPAGGIIDENTKGSSSSLILELQSKGSSYVGGELGWPAPENEVITSKYGVRKDPITGKSSMHLGIDIRTPANSQIVSVNSGTIIYSDWLGSYGKCVIVDHGGGIVTLYAHNELLVGKVGDKVKKGQVISYSGSTGRSTGPHLHFEVRKNGVSINPQAPML